MEVKWLSHNDNLLTAEGFLIVWGPSIELVCGVWQQDAAIFSFGLLDDLEELCSDLRCGRDTPIGRASEDKEHVLACLNLFTVFFIAVTTTGCSCHWWENSFIVCLSATVKYSDDEAVVFLAHCTESVLQVVQWNLLACIGYHDLALIVAHHSVATVVHHSQSLLVAPRVFGNLVLQRKKEFLGLGKV